MTSIFGVPVDAAYHLVFGFTTVLTPILGAAAAVAAIVLFTMAIRALLMPLSLRGLRGQAAQARLTPQLQALRQKYAKQPERLQHEMTALYRREGTSMLAGFTPFLLQWPLLSVMYLLFRSTQIGGKPNALLSRDLFSVPLGSHWLAGAGPASTHGLVFVGIFALLAVLSWLTVRLSKRMAPSTAPVRVPGKALTPKAGAPGVGGTKSGTARAADAKSGTARTANTKSGTVRATDAKSASDPAASGTAGALLRVLPYLNVVIAAFIPLAAGIYLLVSTGWALAERTFFWKTGRLPSSAPIPAKVPVPARDQVA